VAEQVNALTVRENYFEGNIAVSGAFSFGESHTGTASSLCTDIVINGDTCPPVNNCNSLSLRRFAVNAKQTDDKTRAWGFAPGRIILGNRSPCRGVVVEANFHNAICDAGVRYFGAFAAGAEGLRSESNECSHCTQRPKVPGSCRAVGTGGLGANETLGDFEIKLNTGAFDKDE
jgi:hypothetical protein